MRSISRLPVRVLTHNIRYATPSPFKGERPWPERKQLLLTELQYHTRHCGETFICLQEVLHNQLVDVLSGLNQGTDPNAPEWAYIGVGRDDGLEAGEYSPIFYRPDIWSLQHWETMWLSETPKTPSKGWDAASIRIVTIGVFVHRASHRAVLAMNTHLDNEGSRARFESAHLIRRKIGEYRRSEMGRLIRGTFLAGDLNSEETEEAYIALTEPGGLVDTFKSVDPAQRYGNQNTFTGFGYQEDPRTASTTFFWTRGSPPGAWTGMRC
ncbi:Endonuclease/exonuclease/phosphatase [Penicillium lagena]|uniref:Endonuclease/exonuclease/phosphatase n=1 Tax=Penicillium lagena TaxID=94218 RepID=UPI0025407C9D|nr:Endonuclease/exonuclease/phosphatase [Penicillium lagena]KAJ5611102.1 Endonuclease/exonuclease/phosphatase [Penicillium lagena]